MSTNNRQAQRNVNLPSSITPPNKENDKPFHLAASRGDLKALQILIDKELKAANAALPTFDTSVVRRRKSFRQRLSSLFSKGPGTGGVGRGLKTITSSSSIASTLPPSLIVMINEPDRLGMTPLHLACFYEHHDVVSCLLTYGANVNQQTHNPVPNSAIPNPWTFPLHLAAQTGHRNMVKDLLEIGGADPYLLDFRGWTAAEVAERAGHDRIAMMIRDWVHQQAFSGGKQPLILSLSSSRTNFSLSQTELCIKKSHSSVDILEDLRKFSSHEQLNTMVSIQKDNQALYILPDGPWDKDDLFMDRDSFKRSSFSGSLREMPPSIASSLTGESFQ